MSSFTVVVPKRKDSRPEWFPGCGLKSCVLDTSLKYIKINCHNNKNNRMTLIVSRLMGGSSREDYELSCSLFPESIFMSQKEILSAFGNNEYNDSLYSEENQKVVNEFGGEVAKSGTFLRYKNFLSFYFGDSNNAVFVYLYNETKEGIKKLVELSEK